MFSLYRIIWLMICQFELRYVDRNISKWTWNSAVIKMCRSTVGHRSHDPCFHKKYIAGVMTFVAHCTCSQMSWIVHHRRDLFFLYTHSTHIHTQNDEEKKENSWKVFLIARIKIVSLLKKYLKNLSSKIYL